MNIIKLEELMTYFFIENAINNLEYRNTKGASDLEKINKLKQIRNDYLDRKIKFILGEK